MQSDASIAGADQDRGRRVDELERELADARDQQTATNEILSVISSSRTDVQPVFDAIVRCASRLCGGEYAIVTRYDGELLHLVAQHNPRPGTAEETARWFPHRAARPRPSILARALFDNAVIHVPDIETEELAPWTREAYRRIALRALVAVPMVHEGSPVGVVAVSRGTPGPFSHRQIDLLRTFADQAVIAIENTRLFEAEQAGKRELTQSLEYQTAISEVLGVISRSPTDTRPVFESIAQSATKLCGAQHCNVFRFDGKLIHIAGTHLVPGMPPEAWQANMSQPPIAPGRGNAAARSIAYGTVAEIPDIEMDIDYVRRDVTRVSMLRSTMGVPMLKGGRPIGTIVVSRSEPGRFAERQIELLKTFADQAVIAIENTRLFEAEQTSKRELQEALEYQTATSDVLGVIAASPTDIQPVLETLVESACRLCAAYDGIILLREGDWLQVKAHHGPIPAEIANRKITRDWVNGRCVADRVQIHVLDVQAEAAEYPKGAAIAQRVGARTILATPLMREGEAIGAIMIRRDEVRPFSDKQMGLLETFARQAVIAIENTRLFDAEQASKRELEESLEQQTATADVLKVISRSALDVQRVLDALVESAARLCNAHDAAIFQVFGDALRLVAHHGQIATVGPVGQLTIPIERGTMAARAVIERRTIQVADMLAEAREYPESRKRALQNGHRTALAIPLVHGGEAIGVILMRRGEVRPFVERQVELVNTFADQAVIAIENARLFEEVQSRTQELAKTVEDLEIASQHKSQFVANMSHELRTPLAAILGYAELMQEGFYEPQGKKSLDALTRIRSNGKHLLGLINTVLDIAKIESGQFSLNVGEYAIESVVETVRAATESLAEPKKLALKTQVAKKLPVGLGDEQRLTQVLLNLVGNAIKFTDTGEVRITATANNGLFTVAVADTGPGIAQEHQARVFEQFHQVDNSNTKAKGGTGLGLAIAKQIVEMHGGRIWVESTVGKGSTFQMELPIRAEARKAAE